MLSDARTWGPGLIQLLNAQQAEDDLLSPPSLGDAAQALVLLQARIGGKPVIWPVGPGGERLVGAATLLGGRDFMVRRNRDGVYGRRVLLVCPVLVTSLPLMDASGHARALGAKWVAGCAVHAGGIGWVPEGLDEFHLLTSGFAAARRSA
jgi:hypothetical protein